MIKKIINAILTIAMLFVGYICYIMLGTSIYLVIPITIVVLIVRLSVKRHKINKLKKK